MGKKSNKEKKGKSKRKKPFRFLGKEEKGQRKGQN